jgi:hypothetical protein
MPRESTTLPPYWDTYKPYRGEGEQPVPGVETFAWTQSTGTAPVRLRDERAEAHRIQQREPIHPGLPAVGYWNGSRRQS